MRQTHKEMRGQRVHQSLAPHATLRPSSGSGPMLLVSAAVHLPPPVGRAPLSLPSSAWKAFFGSRPYSASTIALSYR
ncbi:hypothetical protein GQ53DRAFT_311807 [Thozetella sp. PMI_491]|nr:hypothetical protein GQ53DRAFT_311807 [Thozetella sp. PMI_491]